MCIRDRTGDERYKIAMDTLRKQMAEQPRTSEGGFWHKLRYPHQMWLDGIFIDVYKRQPEYKLWYDCPAQVWTEALPLGNGRLGAMVYGTPGTEQIQLNEESIWAGRPNNNANPPVDKSRLRHFRTANSL